MTEVDSDGSLGILSISDDDPQSHSRDTSHLGGSAKQDIANDLKQMQGAFRRDGGDGTLGNVTIQDTTPSAISTDASTIQASDKMQDHSQHIDLSELRNDGIANDLKQMRGMSHRDDGSGDLGKVTIQGAAHGSGTPPNIGEGGDLINKIRSSLNDGVSLGDPTNQDANYKILKQMLDTAHDNSGGDLGHVTIDGSKLVADALGNSGTGDLGRRIANGINSTNSSDLAGNGSGSSETASLLRNLLSFLFAAPHAQVNSRAGLGANDVLHWDKLPNSITVLTGPVNVVSDGGLDAVVTSGAGKVFTDQQGSPWAGNFAPGDRLIGTGQFFSTAPIDITFATPVRGVGAQMGYNVLSPTNFLEGIRVFDTANHLLGTYTTTGVMDARADNSAVFIGVKDAVPDIARAEFFTSPGGPGFAINQLSLVDSVGRGLHDLVNTGPFTDRGSPGNSSPFPDPGNGSDGLLGPMPDSGTLPDIGGLLDKIGSLINDGNGNSVISSDASGTNARDLLNALGVDNSTLTQQLDTYNNNVNGILGQLNDSFRQITGKADSGPGPDLLNALGVDNSTLTQQLDTYNNNVDGILGQLKQDFQQVTDPGTRNQLDAATNQLKGMIEKRGQMFDELQKTMDHYHDTADKIIQNIGTDTTMPNKGALDGGFDNVGGNGPGSSDVALIGQYMASTFTPPSIGGTATGLIADNPSLQPMLTQPMG